MKSLKTALRLPLSSRKRLLIVAGIVIVLVGVTIAGIIGSVRYWSDYEETSIASYGDYKKQLDQALASDAEVRLDRLRGLHASLPASTSCSQPATLRWQATVIEDLNKKVSQCHDRLDRLNKMDTSVAKTTRYFADIGKLSQLIADTTGTEDLDESKLKVTAEKWASLPEQIKNAGASSDMGVVTTELEAKILTVSTAWSELHQAHDAKDRAKYEAAAAKVATSYDGLSSLVASIEKLTSEQVKSIETTYSEVMK